jgi:hypothetical protein
MKIHQKIIQTKLNSLIYKNKTPSWGVYSGLPSNTQTDHWDGNNNWTSPRRWLRKSWIFVGLYTADFSIGFAMVDAGFIGKGFCYFHTSDSSIQVEQGTDKPFGFSSDFEGNLDSNWQLGDYTIRSIRKNTYQLRYQGKKFELAIDFVDNDNGLSFVCPSEESTKRPFHFTYKNLLVPMDITLKYRQKKKVYQQVLGSIDFSKGYPPKHTNWNWLSFTGTTTSGIPVGINLVNGFNSNLENAIWMGNKRYLWGEVRFDYQSPLIATPWSVQAVDNNLSLTLTPNGNRKENINLKWLKSKFTQVFGAIEGKVKIEDQWVFIKGFGVMEEHEAVW